MGSIRETSPRPDARHAPLRLPALGARLYADPTQRVFAVLDGARIPRLLRTAHSLGATLHCLFAGQLEPSLQRVAPYLVELDPVGDFTAWLLDAGFGRSWGIFVRTHHEAAALRKHLRRFLMVSGPDGKSLYFRYYDPRVMRLYLPTCNQDEMAQVFADVVDCFAMESEDGHELLEFSRGELEPLTASFPVHERGAAH